MNNKFLFSIFSFLLCFRFIYTHIKLITTECHWFCQGYCSKESTGERFGWAETETSQIWAGVTGQSSEGGRIEEKIWCKFFVYLLKKRY